MPLTWRRLLHPRAFVALLAVGGIAAAGWWALGRTATGPAMVLLLIAGAAAGFANAGST